MPWPCTTGGTERSSRWRRGTSRPCAASTTRAFTTRSRPDSRSSCSTRPPSCARLLLDGHDETARWQALGAAWGPQVEPAFYAFNDLHAVMAWAAAGDTGRAERLIADRERYLDEPRPGVSNYVMTRAHRFASLSRRRRVHEGRYGEAVDLLYPIRHHLNEFGGSHRPARRCFSGPCSRRRSGAGASRLAGSLVRERASTRSPTARTACGSKVG